MTWGLFFLAESEGFKPPIPGKGIPDFESSAFGPSSNSPFAAAKVIILLETTKRICNFNINEHY